MSELLYKVILQIEMDLLDGDVSALCELLAGIPEERPRSFLPEA